MTTPTPEPPFARTNDPGRAGLAPRTVNVMDATRTLQSNPHWQMAIWALRAGYAGLVVVAAGLVLTIAGSTPWVLVTGMTIWLVAALVTMVGFLWGRQDLPEPRPGFWPIRRMLLHDSVHARLR